MKIFEIIDSFLMQLFIVPLMVIGLGVLASMLTKKVFVSPIITLVLNILYEVWYNKHYYPESDMSFTSWNIVFPEISLLFSLNDAKKGNYQDIWLLHLETCSSTFSNECDTH